MEISTIIFSPTYAIGHVVGEIVAILVQIVSGVILPNTIIDNIGLLTMITLLLLLVGIAKKMAWEIVTICWALLIMRIGILTLGT